MDDKKKLSKAEIREALLEKMRIEDRIQKLQKACPGHQAPMTRRALFAHGFVTGLSFVTLPSLFSEFLRISVAHAETNNYPALLQIHCEGGASLAGNAMGFTSNRQALGTGAIRSFGVPSNVLSLPGSTASPFGTPAQSNPFTFLTRNRIYEGLMGSTTASQGSVNSGSALSAAEIACVQMAGICTRSADDDSGNENLTMIGGAAAMAGLRGSSGVPLVGTQNTNVGVDTANAYLATGPRAISAGSITELVNKTTFAPAGLPAFANATTRTQALRQMAMATRDLSNLQAGQVTGNTDGAKLAEITNTAYQNNLDQLTSPPNLNVLNDTQLTPIFVGASNTNTSGIYGSLLKGTLDGVIGSAAFQIGGCDYHFDDKNPDRETRPGADNKDLEIGGRIRQAIKAAVAKGKKTVIVVSTNGNNRGNPNDPEGDWTPDRGMELSMFYFILVTPPGTAKPAQKTAQLGHFTADGSVDPNTNVGNARSAALAILVNYLLLAGKTPAEITSLFGVSAAQIEGFRLFA